MRTARISQRGQIQVPAEVGGADGEAVRDLIDWLIVGGLEVEPV
jgi:hypothetical protein